MSTKKFVLLINPNEFLGSQKSEIMKISEAKKNTKNSLKIKMPKRKVEEWELDLFRTNATFYTNELSKEGANPSEGFKRGQFTTAMFHAIRLLNQTGQPISADRVTEIIKASGIKVDKSQVEEAIGRFKSLSEDVAQSLKHKPLSNKYKTPDGMLLTIAPNGNGGYEAQLTEDQKMPDSRDAINYLTEIIQTFAVVSGKKTEFIPSKTEQDAEAKVVTMNITGVQKLAPLEEEALQAKRFYDDARGALERRIEEIKSAHRAFPQSALDDMAYWTNLTVGDICQYKHDGCLAPNIYTIAEKHKAEKELLRLADFLREFYALVERKTGVTKEDISSDRKSRKIAKARHMMMYVLRKRFDLSSGIVGIILGAPGRTPKNHATVLFAEKQKFDESVGLEPSKYKDRRLEINNLYDDAQQKYEAKHQTKTNP